MSMNKYMTKVPWSVYNDNDEIQSTINYSECPSGDNK